MEHDRGRLGEIRLLASLPAAELTALERRCRWRRYHAGEQILDRDSTTRDVLFISEGRIRVVNYAASGREIAFAVVEAGGHVGELSAIDGEGRSADGGRGDRLHDRLAVRRGVRRAAGAPRRRGGDPAAPSVRRSSAPATSGSPSSRCSARCRGSIASCCGSPRRTRPTRAPGGSPSLPTQQDIASRVGATRETVARALGQILSTGVVQRRGRTLLIRDREMLEELSDPPDAA